MPAIPPDEVTIKDVYAWYEAKQALDKLRATETVLRDRVFKKYFPAPTEGTNHADLGDGSGGYELKLAYTIERKVDPVQFKVLSAALVKDCHALLTSLGIDPAPLEQDKTLFEVLGIGADTIVRYKPELETKKYRTLTPTQQKVVEMFLTLKPGSPQITVEPNAETKKAQEIAAAPKPPEELQALRVSTDLTGLEIPVLGSKPPF